MATSNQGGKQGGSSVDKGVGGRGGSVNRGFVSKDPERQREVPDEAARVARKSDVAPEFTSEADRQAGTKGKGKGSR